MDELTSEKTEDRRIKNLEAITAKEALVTYLAELRANQNPPNFSNLPRLTQWRSLADKIRAVLTAVNKKPNGGALFGWREVKAVDLRYPSVKLGAYLEGLVCMLERDPGPCIEMRLRIFGEPLQHPDDKQILAVFNLISYRKVSYGELTPAQWTRLGVLLAPHMPCRPVEVLRHYISKLNLMAQNDLAPAIGWFALHQIQVEELFWREKNGGGFSRILVFLYGLRNSSIDGRLRKLALNTPETTSTPEACFIRDLSPEESREWRGKMRARFRQAKFREKNTMKSVTGGGSSPSEVPPAS